MVAKLFLKKGGPSHPACLPLAARGGVSLQDLASDV